MKAIAVIPARGGSKRIPRKNIKFFAGKPMIAWSIEAAFASGCFSDVIVSTDDSEIAAVARQYGAQTPFIRPPELANDTATTRAVMHHAVNYILAADETLIDRQTAICCIYATAPFLTGDVVKQAFDRWRASKKSFCFSVTSYAFPIQRALQLEDDGSVKMFNEQYRSTRSQDLIEAYHDAGQFYWGSAAAFATDLPMFSEHGLAYQLPRKRVQDIDTLEDWEFAELLFEAWQRQ